MGGLFLAKEKPQIFNILGLFMSSEIGFISVTSAMP
jgi:hypothetical protein